MKAINSIILMVLLVVVGVAAGPPKPQAPESTNSEATAKRTWTSNDGKYTVVAEFVDFSDEFVRLRKEDNTVISVPLARLSHTDRKLVEALSLTVSGDGAAAKPDAPLTLAAATRDIDAHKGKLVRWYAVLSSVEGERATYINNPGARTASDFRFFAVKLKDFSEGRKYDGGYISGKIIDSAEITIRTTSNGGVTRTKTQKVPLLDDVSFEKALRPKR